jgi:hypothetical protein
VSDDPNASRKLIQHYRRLREWITDLRTRRALRELIKNEEAKLAEKKEREPSQDPDDQRRD